MNRISVSKKMSLKEFKELHKDQLGKINPVKIDAELEKQYAREMKKFEPKVIVSTVPLVAVVEDEEN